MLHEASLHKCVLLLVFAFAPGVAAAQPAAAPGPAAQQHYDLNVYPSVGGGSAYDLGTPSAQIGSPGPIVASSSAPPPAYSFKDVLANTHGFLEAGLSSRGGYGYSGGVSIPILPGKADLDLAAGTGQIAGWGKTPNGKPPLATYDSYSAGLHFRPTDDTEAYIGITGLRLHDLGPNPGYAFGLP
jgi:hypothetical protein